MDNISCRIEHNTYGNIWFKQMEFLKKGDFKTPHKHNYDHVTFIVKGSVEVFSVPFDDIGKPDMSSMKSLGIYKAPTHLEVPKELTHYVVALEDESLAYCVEAIRDGEEVITTNFAQ